MMGLYDNILFRCPSCGTKIFEQSKGGMCDLDTYEADSAPVEVLAYLNDCQMECHSCGDLFLIKIKADYKLLRIEGE